MILLTGASGFIGSHLIKALLFKYGYDNVVVLTSKPRSDCNYLLHDNYTFSEDFFTKNGFQLIDTIIHAGAFTPKSASESNDVDRCYSNIFTTQKLLNSNFPNLKRFIYLSTLDVYGKDSIITEESLISPVSLYGHSKYYGEKAISMWSNQKNVKCIILRIGHVYGPGEENYQKLIPIVIRRVLNDEPITIFGKGNELRTFIYISDVVQAIVNAIEYESDVEVINVVGDKPISVKELTQKIIKLAGKNIEIKYVEKNIISRDLIFDNTRLRHLHQPKVFLDEGLRLEIEYFRSL